MYFNGRDKMGRPIVYIRPGEQNPYSPEVRLKYLTWMMEQCVAKMDEKNGVEKVVWIADFASILSYPISNPRFWK
jgi:hypothetical protein